MTKRVVAHIPDNLHTKLVRKADAETRSISQMIGTILAKALNPTKSANPKDSQ